MKIIYFVRSTCLILLLGFITSCTDIVKVVRDDATPESAYCTLNETFTTFYTIEGDAFYKRRSFTGAGLGGIDGTDFPIRRAEVRILDSSGNTIQCTETDENGHYIFTVPDDNATYTLKVLSRSYNQYNKASVLDTPDTNTPYSISGNFVADGDKTLPDILAPADNNDLRGGAFNILDQIYLANDYLLNNTVAFTVTHKVQAYWKKGVNPLVYFGGDEDTGVSFYVPGSDKLYILGGVNGDYTVEDTDHFDNSVIIHEFGHFVEDNYSRTDSPGGTHYGLYVIDPRLAWSEGFATYFSSQVTGDPIYRDTVGIGGGYGYYYDMENNLNEDNDPQDMPTAGSLGEGGFRELAVARFMWEATNGTMPFSEFWTAYIGGFKNTLSFREISLLLKVQANTFGATSLAALLPEDDKEMTATRSHYGIEDNAATTDDANDTDCQWTINPADPVPIAGDVFDKSDQFYSNDFFYLNHPGGALTVHLSGNAGDLDIYLYKSGYAFGVGDDIQVYSNNDLSSIETINSTVPAGKYMINIMYYGATNASANSTYTLRINGDYVCR